MSKYDCTKTLDYAHEFTRMCDDGCEACPLRKGLLHKAGCGLRKLTEETIAIVQKWSDEHPEVPKLTKKERAFVEGVMENEGVFVQRLQDGKLALLVNTIRVAFLPQEWFKFIERNQTMSVFELLVLEVEDE